MPTLQRAGFAARAAARLALWLSRARERSALRQLDDHLLNDVGLSREGALTEASRPPWSGKHRDGAAGTAGRQPSTALQSWVPRCPRNDKRRRSAASS